MSLDVEDATVHQYSASHDQGTSEQPLVALETGLFVAQTHQLLVAMLDQKAF